MRWIYLFSIVFLSGCSSLFLEEPTQYEVATGYGCTYFLDDEYHCPDNVPKSFSSSNKCTWVNAYLRKDGTPVKGHLRCVIPNSFSRPSSKTFSGGNCHTVRGYTRKNGTYVSGYVRCN